MVPLIDYGFVPEESIGHWSRDQRRAARDRLLPGDPPPASASAGPAPPSLAPATTNGAAQCGAYPSGVTTGRHTAGGWTLSSSRDNCRERCVERFLEFLVHFDRLAGHERQRLRVDAPAIPVVPSTQKWVFRRPAQAPLPARRRLGMSSAFRRRPYPHLYPGPAVKVFVVAGAALAIVTGSPGRRSGW